MKDKLNRIKKLVEKKRIDLLLLSTEPNIRYLTDQYKLNCLIAIPNKTESFILTSVTGKTRLEKSDFEVFSVSSTLEADIRSKTYFKALKKVIKTKDLKIKKLGYEKNILPYGSFERIKKQFKCKIIDISDEISKIRSIKNPEEIKRLEVAASIVSKAMKITKEIIKEGLTERELALIIEQVIREKSDWYSFETIVASGPNSAFIHHMPTDRKIRKNDLIVVDCGAIYKNYCSDITRTFCLKPNEKTNNIYKKVLETQELVLKKIKLNTKAKTLHNLAKKTMEKSGYQLFHAIGHGVGIEIHEEPSISYDSKSILKPNMIFTIEPGIYLRGFGGVRIEDMILLTKKGIKVLTKVPRGLNES